MDSYDIRLLSGSAFFASLSFLLLLVGDGFETDEGRLMVFIDIAVATICFWLLSRGGAWGRAGIRFPGRFWAQTGHSGALKDKYLNYRKVGK